MALNIGGFAVHFPYTAYPSQMSMMNRTIQSIEKGQNCLLESPTGSGKSLALLCASLAWVEKQLELKNNEENNSIEFEGSSAMDEVDNWCNSLKNEFPSNKIACSKCDCHVLQKLSSMNKNIKVPKIYFGTRTHKQIAQLVREMKKTKYKNMKMTILSSRAHSCIHGTAMHSNNLTEACQDLIKHGSCEYYSRRKKTDTHTKLKNMGLGSAWDIEDLIKVLSKVGSCPYYSARDLIAESSIVFCPYNYLLDPIFRQAVNLNLNDSILILDEAHNIEDASRSAASFSINDEQLAMALKDISELISVQLKLEHTMPLKSMVESMVRLLELTESRLMREGSEDTSQVWTGMEIVGMLKQINLGPETFQIMKKHFSSLCEDENAEYVNNDDKEDQQLMLKGTSKIMFESLFTVLDFIYKENFKFRDDYRMAVIQSRSFDKQNWQRPNSKGAKLGVWLPASQQKHVPPKQTVSLNFWCLNSAVIFEELGRITRNIVLTSGTLSPLISFQSELGVLFPLRLEAHHIIPANQILVGSIGRGPSGNEICCTFQNSETFVFQDDIGGLVLRASKVVPHGILCFFPSYSMMDKLINRWQFTGLLNELKSVKHVMIEPRSSSQYDAWLKEFNSHIRNGERNLPGENGVLLFAVCRGKVSEGMDFADNHARLVLTVGIPFPNFKDVQVQLKRLYNDSNRNSSRRTMDKSSCSGTTSGSTADTLSQAHLLAGSEWYEVQAYRALNQALGRCIRHRDDWGAIIMVDVRFGNNPTRYMSGVSKWLRHRVTHYSNCDRMLESLSSFVKERVAVDEAIKKTERIIEYEEEDENDDTKSTLEQEMKTDANDGGEFEVIRRKKRHRNQFDNNSDGRNILNCLNTFSNTPPPKYSAKSSLIDQNDNSFVDLTEEVSESFNSTIHPAEIAKSKKSVFVNLCSDDAAEIEETRRDVTVNLTDGDEDLFQSTSYLPFSQTVSYKQKALSSNRKPKRAISRRKKSIFD